MRRVVAYVVQHADCGCVAMRVPGKETAREMRAALAAAGYTRWRVRTMAPDAAGAAYAARAVAECGTCPIDPSRPSLAALWGTP